MQSAPNEWNEGGKEVGAQEGGKRKKKKEVEEEEEEDAFTRDK